MEVIKIKCPCCGAILALKPQGGIEKISITCPVCKEMSPFKAYKLIVKKTSEPTDYPNGNSDGKTEYDKTGGATEIGETPNLSIGQLRVLNSPATKYRLKPGKNIIGRKASASTADFQISITDSKRTSREHLMIEVKKVPGKGLTHYVSLYKEKVNATHLNNERLVYGDCLILNHGDKIKLPDTTLLFEIPDEEGTDF